MRVVTYVYDSASAKRHVEQVLAALDEREERVERLDIDGDDREGALREAMLTVRDAVRIGTSPEGIYDDDGYPDFSAGAMITEQPTGRRELHVGEDALEVLTESE